MSSDTSGALQAFVGREPSRRSAQDVRAGSLRLVHPAVPLADGPREREIALPDHPLFEGVDLRSPDLRQWLSSLRLESFAAGRSEDIAARNTCLLVLAGAFHVFGTSQDGRCVTFDIATAGGVVGLVNVEASPIGKTAVVLLPGRAAVVTEQDLNVVVRLEPRIAINLFRLAQIGIEHRNERLFNLALGRASAKVATALLSLPWTPMFHRGQRQLVAIRPRPTHQSVADIAGLRRETVSIEFTQLRAHGIIQVLPDRLMLDRPRLQTVARRQ